jgi:hypothetical protein
MYGVSTTVVVKSLELGKRILLEWGVDEEPTTVGLTFSAIIDDTTSFSITNSGFSGGGDKVVVLAMDSAAGFELVLAG